MSIKFPPCPDSLKTVQPYLKLAADYDEKDPIVSYWCRLFALQTALNIDKKSNEAKNLLLPLMDWLEKTKRAPDTSESITSEIAAQAYIENYALKVFVYADNMDRAGTFNKNVVKSYYASGLLFDVMTVFGELNEDIANNRKYAKWKAAYIHKCLSNGETPISGPVNNNESDQGNTFADEEKELDELLNVNRPGSQPPSSNNTTYNVPGISSSSNVPSHLPVQPDNVISYNPHPTPASETPQSTDGISSGGITRGPGPAEIAKAQKFCKFALSALNYDDVVEAINNLQQALELLQTGFSQSKG